MPCIDVGARTLKEKPAINLLQEMEQVFCLAKFNRVA